MSWTSSSTFHNLHHQKLNGNYGLFFRFWDRLLDTELPGYEQAFNDRSIPRHIDMQALPVSGGQHAVAVADLNGDTYPEIVFTVPNQGQLGILWNLRDGTFQTTTIPVTGTPYSLAVVDLNGDLKTP
jgi:hypothetical protein